MPLLSRRIGGILGGIGINFAVSAALYAAIVALTTLVGVSSRATGGRRLKVSGG